MITIDRSTALSLLEQAVAERGPDYVYPNVGHCTYTDNGKPSCGVGLALYIAGVPLHRLEALDAEEYIPSIYGVCTLLSDIVTIDFEALNVLGTFQGNQDVGYSWADSLGQARLATTF